MEGLPAPRRALSAVLLAALLLVIAATTPGSGAAFSTSRGSGAMAYQAAASFGTHAQAVTADSPAAYWRLGESSATTVDSGSSGADGVWTGTGITGGVAGALTTETTDKATSFAGTGHIAADSPVLTITGRATWSVEAWARPTVDDTGVRHVIRCADNATISGLSVHIQGDDLKVDRYANSTFDSTPYLLVSVNAWTHVAATYDGTNVRTYLNGSLANTYTSTRSIGTPTVGGCPAGPCTSNNNFIGSIDEIAVYSTVLTAAQVTARYDARSAAAPGYRTTVLAQNPLLYYRLTESPGAAYDSTSGATTATATATGTSPVSGALTGGDGARRFDGTAYLSATNNALFTFTGTQAFSVEAWARPTTVDTNSRSIARCQSGSTGWWVFNRSGAGLAVDRYDGATYSSPRGALLAAGTWVHVAVTYDGATLRLYRNGTLAGSAASAWASSALTCAITLGGTTSAGTTGWIGDLDEVAVYRTALTDAQVMIHYQRQV